VTEIYAEILYALERIVLSRDAGFCECIKEGGFADVRQADDAAFETHDVCFAER